MSEVQLGRIEAKLDKALENEAKRNILVEKRLSTSEVRIKVLMVGVLTIGTFIFDLIKKKLGM